MGIRKDWIENNYTIQPIIYVLVYNFYILKLLNLSFGYRI